LIEKNTHYL